MPFYEHNLRQWMESNPTPQLDARKLRVVRGLLHALALLHSRNIIHRDVKPENVMLATDGSPVLTDFETSRVAELHGRTTTTVVGTRGYMHPQVLSGKAQACFASDLYSFGVLLAEMLGVHLSL